MPDSRAHTAAVASPAATGRASVTLRCRVFGHRYRFSATGTVMRWECQRDCGAGGSKTYPSPAAAHHYASAFDREDRDQLGRHAPLLGMFPLRIWHKIHERSRQP
jgi:hypothetical protein